MKGMSDWFMGLIVALASIMGMFAFFVLVQHNVSIPGQVAQDRMGGVGVTGLVFFGDALRKRYNSTKTNRPKGIVLSTMMIATIVFVVVVSVVLFMIFAGIQANAGNTAGGFFYGVFDAIMRLLPGAG